MRRPQSTVRVLVVNENQYAAGTLVSAIRKELPPDTAVRQATDIQGAMDLINAERYHAVVVSQDLPDGKGVTLVRSLLLLSRKPSGVFLIAGIANGETDVARFIKEHPEVSLIQKPFRYAVVAELVRNSVVPSQSTEQSYYGLRLSELIQAFSLGRRNATIQLIMPDNKLAAIYIDKGELIHAVYGDEEGKSALGRIIESKKGVIRVEKHCPTAKHTITEPTQHVLIDIYRQMDEERWSSTPSTPPAGDLSPDDDLDGIIDDAFNVTPQPQV